MINSEYDFEGNKLMKVITKIYEEGTDDEYHNHLIAIYDRNDEDGITIQLEDSHGESVNSVFLSVDDLFSLVQIFRVIPES